MDVRVGRSARPKPGERESGDRVVLLDDGRELLLAVIDGLGHGPRAAEAAHAAERVLVENASMPLPELFQHCDRAIAHTRGVAMTVVRASRERRLLMHAGVGNVELRSIARPVVSALPQPGVVGGRRVRSVRETVVELSVGDLFVLFSDGISSRIDLDAYRQLGVQAMADAIVRDHGKEHDDASCAVLGI